MLVCVGSTNPVKLEAVRDAIKEIGKEWEVKGVQVSSNVSEQPWCNETLVGARNRAINALIQDGCDVGVGIEGGVCWERERIVAFAAIYVVNREKENFSYSPAFTLSNELAKLVIRGKELGEATDIVYGKTNTKHGEGAVGMLTRIVDRKRLYKDAVILALYPFYIESER
ncbi:MULTISPECIES: DUF84 family protein [Metallosphaera]|uniref:DUF84 family protein n=1 Tax=Metallosphaera TaxID=41980 RepID=UPI001F068E2E|nr:inosine/xanthosine triphosphatase [Metallosphaera sedula]MCH1772256.1 inosine/xanthosine triphosphatase [Metallosphaera sedula]MCP6728377.1 inosine/xanthosine triphosphatase [Metallosphaera sedula]